MSQQPSNIELTPQEFRSRFQFIVQLNDPFARNYIIATDTATNKRSIYKHYLAQTQDQLEAIYDNISNYIKLSQQQGICKILAYTRLISEQEILATFQYNDYSLAEYIKTSQFVQNKPQFYIQLLQQLSVIVKSMSEIGIDVDQLNYGNILVSREQNEMRIKVFYDEREKTFDKVLEGVKTFTSLEKLTALITGNEEYFNELAEFDDGISPQNIFQLGLLLIDLMYKCEAVQLEQDGFLVRDRPVSRSSVPNVNDEKSYYLFEDGTVVKNEEYLSQKIAYLSSNSTRIVKELTVLAQLMIAHEDRLNIHELAGQIDRIEKIYRDISKKTVRSVTGESATKPQSNENIKAVEVNVDLTNTHSKNTQQYHQHNNSVANQDNVEGSNVISVDATNKGHRRPFDEASNENIQNQHQKSQQSQLRKSYSQQNNQQQNQLQFYNENQQEQKNVQKHLPSLNPMIKKKNSSSPIDTFALGNDEGTNLSTYYQTTTNNPLSSYDQYSSSTNNYTANIHKDNTFYKESSTSNTLINTKESLGDKVGTTNIINEHFTHNSNATINNYPESEGSKRNSTSQNKLDVSNERPPKLLIPKEAILTNLKVHESIRSSLQTLLHEIDHMPQLRKKQYYDNSVYYGGVSQQTNKRTGLGIYLYPSGDVYFGTWLENQLVDGTYIFKNGESYEGSVRNGKQGWGRYRYSNGNVYEGEWKDDIKDGKGTMWYPNLDKYEGQWVKGKKNGWGKYFYNNGTIYQGNFLNGRKQGFGTIIFSNGTKIEANWQQTHVQGQGKVFYPNGDFFHGQYHMSEKHGKGMYMWGSDSTKYQGEFKKDSLQGQARIYFTSTQYYYGRIRNGKREGQGNYVYENGDSFNGEWKNDMKLLGHYRFKNGDQFQGKFKDNQLNFGVIKYANGELYEGEFKNGYRHGVGSYRDIHGQLVCEGHWDNDNFIQAGQ